MSEKRKDTKREYQSLPAEEFVWLARMILARFATKHAYFDKHVSILTDTNGLAMQVERRANRNPVTMVLSSGQIIRHHGEHGYLVPHMQKLLADQIHKAAS